MQHQMERKNFYNGKLERASVAVDNSGGREKTRNGQQRKKGGGEYNGVHFCEESNK